MSLPGWMLDPKMETRLRRMKDQLEYALIHAIGVESAAWSVARDLDALLDIHGSAPVDQVDLFLEPASVGQAKVLDHMLHLLDQGDRR